MKKVVKDVANGFKDAIAYLQGDKSRAVVTEYIVPDIDVKTVREKTGLTQDAFSQLFAIKIRTLQDWEQGRRRPTTQARVLLAIIDQNPQSVKRTLKLFVQPIARKVKR